MPGQVTRKLTKPDAAGPGPKASLVLVRSTPNKPTNSSVVGHSSFGPKTAEARHREVVVRMSAV